MKHDWQLVNRDVLIWSVRCANCPARIEGTVTVSFASLVISGDCPGPKEKPGLPEKLYEPDVLSAFVQDIRPLAKAIGAINALIDYLKTRETP